MTKKYKIGIVIGRFQPLHTAHSQIIQKAKEEAETVYVFIGSAGGPRTPKNPFTFKERHDIISRTIAGVTIMALYDDPYNENRWRRQITENRAIAWFGEGSKKVAIFGHKSDASSYYLDSFPYEFVPVNVVGETVHATEIRQHIFESNVPTSKSEFMLKNLRTPSRLAIDSLRNSEHFEILKEEYEFYQKHKETWSSSPFPPTWQTADALVRFGKNILVIRRANAPGKGLLALPGGYVDQHETLKAAAARELIEETSMRFTPDELDKFITKSKTYDSPGRSLRGRVFTKVFEYAFDDSIPYVKAADDAAEAFWIHTSQMEENEFFEDHFHIIEDMLS